MNKLIIENKYPKLFKFQGYWLDIGRKSDFVKANIDISI